MYTDIWNLTPRETLFCRDAKPMEGSYAGKGGNLPSPSTLHGAILSAYTTYLNQAASYQGQDRKIFLDALKTAGPFPAKENRIYFKTPLDLAPCEENSAATLKLLKADQDGCNDLPKPLQYILSAPKATKDTLPDWIDQIELRKYLNGCTDLHFVKGEELFLTERRYGIGINPETGTTEDGKFYQAEYLRFNPGVTIRAYSTGIAQEIHNGLFQAKCSIPIRLGGQQTLCAAEQQVVPPKNVFETLLPDAANVGCFVKWILLTPAAWRHGWLPDFINEDGSLKLPSEERLPRKPGESREAWRTRMRQLPSPFPHTRLIAARVGKPQVLSGWHTVTPNGNRRYRVKGEVPADEGLTAGPRATRLFVPAGTVYYFQTSGKEESLALMKALCGRATSSFEGTAGYGIGCCGIFTI